MSDNDKPNDVDDGQTIDEPVESPEAAPKEGVERADAQPSGKLVPFDASSAEPQVLEKRAGMWSRGSGDTSGYGGIERIVQMPEPTARPFGGWFDSVADRMEELVPGFCYRVVVDRGEITFYVHREKLVELVGHTRDDAHLRFENLVSVSGVHYPNDVDAELHVAYHLLSVTHNRRIRIEVTAPDNDPHIPSVVATYPMADWHERETWDMFGVIFDTHPALTRILMPDDWVGHPQRKDYPLGGIAVEYKGATVPPPDQRRSYS